MFVGGNLHRGSQWSAGEIGYLRVLNISREHPAIHKHGKLEKALGAAGILKSWRASSQVARTSVKVNRAADIFELAAAGKARAPRVLKWTATELADCGVGLAPNLHP